MTMTWTRRHLVTMMRQCVVLATTLQLDHLAVRRVLLGWLTWMVIHRRRVYHAWQARRRSRHIWFQS